MLRILLFLGTNLAIMLVLGIVCSIFGIDQWAYGKAGINLQGLLVMCAVFGMGGAFISLAMSKTIAKWTTHAQVIEQPRGANEQWLLDTVRQHAQQAGIGMPEVALYDSPDMNAFATGMSRNHALVAVSTGLLQSMNRDEISAVLGHEITHVANGDMVTLTLIQGVLNTFVMFLARIIGSVVDSAIGGNRDDNRGGGIGYFLIVMLLQTVLGFLATIVVMWFSRWREFRADAGGARLGSRAGMIAALQTLSGSHESGLPKAVQAFGISGDSGVARLFMSHPPIAERIAALKAQG
ncbi:MAG TPA: protease HtpX [Rudaea sp.]|jgi:heat shock protein HtpX|nr:protease HtpX [Rudaea sp.]